MAEPRRLLVDEPAAALPVEQVDLIELRLQPDLRPGFQLVPLAEHGFALDPGEAGNQKRFGPGRLDDDHLGLETGTLLAQAAGAQA